MALRSPARASFFRHEEDTLCRSPLKLMDWSHQLIVWILVAMKSVSAADARRRGAAQTNPKESPFVLPWSRHDIRR